MRYQKHQNHYGNQNYGGYNYDGYQYNEDSYSAYDQSTYQFSDTNSFSTKNRKKGCKRVFLWGCLTPFLVVILGGIIISVVLGVIFATDTSIHYVLNADEQSYAVSYIGDAFKGELEIPEMYEGLPVTEIRDRACVKSKITSVAFPDSIQKIGSEAFLECESLTNVSFGNNSQLTTVGDYAFSNCKNLENFIFEGKTDLEIQDRAFYQCRSMSEASFLNVKSLALGAESFVDCDSLKAFHINDNYITMYKSTFNTNKVYTEYNNAYYFGSANNPYEWFVEVIDKKAKEIAIHEDAVTIYPEAFAGCTELRKITLSSNILAIGSSAFKGCTMLLDITIPTTVRTMGENVFEKCNINVNVYSSEFPEGWDEKAFYNTLDITINDISEEGLAKKAKIEKDIQAMKDKHSQLLKEAESLEAKGFSLDSQIKDYMADWIAAIDRGADESRYVELIKNAEEKQAKYWEESVLKIEEAEELEKEIKYAQEGIRICYGDFWQNYGK